jgi:hypothetical protein
MDDPEQDGSGSRTPAIAGLAIAVVLLVAGLWLAHELTATSKMQDCLMSGRTNCNVIEPARWRRLQPVRAGEATFPTPNRESLIAGMPPAVLATIIRGRLPAMPVETVIDAIRRAVDGMDHPIRWNVGAGIEIRRTIIVQVDFIGPAGMAMMVPDVHVRIGGK